MRDYSIKPQVGPDDGHSRCCYIHSHANKSPLSSQVCDRGRKEERGREREKEDYKILRGPSKAAVPPHLLYIIQQTAACCTREGGSERKRRRGPGNLVEAAGIKERQENRGRENAR